jgi:hypothetical protein
VNGEPTTRMERRLRLSGSLVLAGLLVEAASIVWFTPLAFLAFAIGGGLLVAAGVVIFLTSLVFVAR